MNRLITLVLLSIAYLGLGGCAATGFQRMPNLFDSHTYDPMTAEESRKMDTDCLAHAACRGYYAATLATGPVDLDILKNNNRGCLPHAIEANQRAQNAGFSQTCVLVGLATACHEANCAHALLAVKYRGEFWAVDNNGLSSCNGVCKLSQAVKTFKPSNDASYGASCGEVMASLGLDPKANDPSRIASETAVAQQ